MKHLLHWNGHNSNTKYYLKTMLKWGQNGLKYQNYCQASNQIAYCRSENNVKNHFYGAVRKLVRKINAVKKKERMKPSKPFKEQLILKIINRQAVSSTEKLNEMNCSSVKVQSIE